MHKNFTDFQFSDIQYIVLCMLKESCNWGTFHNHNSPSEICLLCHTIVLWFNLANLIFEKHAPPLPMHSQDDEDELLPPVHKTSRPSFFVSSHYNTLIEHTVDSCILLKYNYVVVDFVEDFYYKEVTHTTRTVSCRE